MQDNFFRFLFAFIYRNCGAIEIDPEMGKKLIWKDINAYFGKAFEGIAEEFWINLNKKCELPLNSRKSADGGIREKKLVSSLSIKQLEKLYSAKLSGKISHAGKRFRLWKS